MTIEDMEKMNLSGTEPAPWVECVRTLLDEVHSLRRQVEMSYSLGYHSAVNDAVEIIGQSTIAVRGMEP